MKTQAQKTAEGAPPDKGAGHHKYSPSTLHYRAECPAWAKTAVEIDSEAAQEGQRLHEELEKGGEGLTAQSPHFLRMCAAFLHSRIESLKEVGEVQQFNEVSLEVQGPDNELITRGRADCVLVAGNVAEILDYKFGFVPVEAPENNYQLLAYAVGVAQKWPNLRVIRAWIAQPRIYYYRDVVWFISPEWLQNAVEEIAAVIRRAKEADSAEEKGGVEARWKYARPCGACLYCGHVKQCPRAKSAWAKMTAPFLLEPDKVELDFQSLMKASPEVVGATITHVRWIQNWAKTWLQEIADLTVNGAISVPPGWRLKQFDRIVITKPERWIEWASQFVDRELINKWVLNEPETVLGLAADKLGLSKDQVIKNLGQEGVLGSATSRPFLTKVTTTKSSRTNETQKHQD